MERLAFGLFAPQRVAQRRRGIAFCHFSSHPARGDLLLLQLLIEHQPGPA
jgi:hypothetical protein